MTANIEIKARVRRNNPYLEMGSKTDLLTGPDKPLGRIILVPLDRIPVVHGELVVEVVITFTNRDKRSEHMVTRRMLVIERRLSQPVSE